MKTFNTAVSGCEPAMTIDGKPLVGKRVGWGIAAEESEDAEVKRPT
jgi:hypothetical protein